MYTCNRSDECPEIKDDFILRSNLSSTLHQFEKNEMGMVCSVTGTKEMHRGLSKFYHMLKKLGTTE
jgi:hypothetical protein